MDRHPHILNASTNLLGICLGLITGLRLTNFGETSVGDEVAWAAALIPAQPAQLVRGYQEQRRP